MPATQTISTNEISRCSHNSLVFILHIKRARRRAKKKKKKLTGQSALGSKTNRQNRHQSLISHRINHGADNGLAIPPARNPSIQQIRDAGIREQSDSPDIRIMQDVVANDWRSKQSRKREKVGEVVNVFVEKGGCNGFLSFLRGFGCWCRF